MKYMLPEEVLQLEAKYGEVSDLHDVNRMGRTIVGPHDLIRLERLREAVFREDAAVALAPVLTHVLYLGESPSTYVTKVGGSPHRHRDKPWPLGAKGAPVFFLCQFVFEPAMRERFNLEGDVLCVFAESLDICAGSLGLICEWNNREDPCGPVGMNENGRIEQPDFVTCWGKPIRSWDIVGQEAETAALEALVSEFACDSSGRVPFLAQWLCTTLGLKIGGMPYSDFSERREEDGRRLLCMLPTIVAASEAWPWMNMKQGMPATKAYSVKLRLDIRDGFVLHFWQVSDAIEPEIVFM